MMEFTFDGMVRYGFGFYNPNHAAALICALFPFLWTAWLKWTRLPVRIPIVLLNLLLLVALVLTYSRTGVLVLCLEMTLFCISQRKVQWKTVLIFCAVFAVILSAGGIVGRFSLDRAITNRPAIWWAGMMLFAGNPFGVGAGNSGLLVTAFLLPDGIICRTLISSHLTLLVEYGILPGILWFGVIFYAFFCGRRMPAVWSSFIGLTVSASAATVFDWGVLFDFSGLGNLPVMNFILSWILFLFYIFLLLLLCCRSKFCRKDFSAAAGCSLLVMLVVFVSGRCGSREIPRICGEYVVKEGKTVSLALYDDSWNMKDVLAFLPDGYCLPLCGWEKRQEIPEGNWDRILLFGKCAASGFYSSSDCGELIFVSPPDYVAFPANLKKIYLKRFGEEYLRELAQDCDLEICYY